LTAQLVLAKKGSILAVDADPNSCFADALGAREPGTIVGICEEISKNIDKIPASMTKDRFIEMKVQEALVEGKDFDLLVMGRPEGPGCYCYVNNLLRDIMGKIAANYDFVVIDNAAGMEHISRRTTREITRLLVVSDYSIAGIRSAKRIYDLAVELGIKMSGAYLVINKVSGPLSALNEEIKKTGLEVIGDVPYDEALIEWNISDRSIFGFKEKAVRNIIADILNKLMESQHAIGAGKRKI